MIITMAVSFAISFSILWWQRKTADLAVPTADLVRAARTSSVESMQISRPAQQSLPALSRPPSADPAGSISRPAAAGKESPATEIPPNNYDGPELPVMFVFGTSPMVVNPEEGSGGSRTVKEMNDGIVSNLSENPLSLTVTEVNVPTQETWQAQISIGKGGMVHFGVNQGLKMQSGDQITLRSPSFRDLTRDIP